MITHVIFDFDGVMAETGFRLALASMSTDSDLELSEIAGQGMRALLKSGYVTGQGSEEDFWDLLCETTDIRGDRSMLRAEIIARSVLRPQMLETVDQLRASGLTVALLSDHTDWLDEIVADTGFTDHFDYFYNSYYLQQSKRDPLVFDRVVKLMEAVAGETLFVDDNPANVERAVSRGLLGIVYQDFAQLVSEMAALGLEVIEPVE
ncbi:MAG: HAD-IA family hydrolase [Gammaproteobacteria bacterium]